MKRIVVILVVLLLVAGGVWALTGGLTRTVEDRLENRLVAAGLSRSLSACMAERMTDRLSVVQLRKLERLGPEEGETAAPMTMAALLERVRRVGDREVLEVTAGSAAVCAFTAT